MAFTLNVGFAVILTVALAVLAAGHNRPAQESARELRMVHVVMRHGMRTPVSTYPKDPYINHEFGPNGWGQLTKKGISELHEFGKYLRGRYGKFLGDKYNNSQYYSQSTGVERAISSLMAVNAGLWQPNKEQRWNMHLKWLPIPVYSQPLDEDDLLLVRKDCPQYNIELERVENLPEVQTKLEHYKSLLEYIHEQTGQEMNNFYDIEDVFATLSAEKSYGLTLPEWTKEYFPEKMEAPASYSFALKNYNTKLRRLKGGLLLKKILSDWKSKTTNTLSTKAILYGGHDSTVANLLSALNIFDPQVPNYGMAVMLEFKYDKDDNKYGLEIFVKNSTAPPYQMQIPECDKFCPLEEVIKLTEAVIPLDWSAECATDDPNYTTSKPSGP